MPIASLRVLAPSQMVFSCSGASIAQALEQERYTLPALASLPLSPLPLHSLKALTFGAQTAPVLPRRTQIIATLGPASSSPEKIRALISAGVNVFRLNFSHGTQEIHGQTVDTIRTAASELQKPVMILADMQGPKIRVGTLPTGSLELVAGQEVSVISADTTTEAMTIPTTYPQIVQDVNPQDPTNRILMDDGKLELKPLRKENEKLICQVVRGGTLTNKKGINLPGVKVSTPSLSPKDQSDIQFALNKGVDFIAMSFVRTAADLQKCRQLIQAQGKDVPIIAKIEKPEAILEENLIPIIQEADGIMVARGDLGVEVDITRLPQLQKRIIKECNRLSKPVIVATQMLESMMNNSQPNRSDITDMANAVEDGADLLMLSGETSVGKYPVEAVQMMASVIEQAELPVAPTPKPTPANKNTPIWETFARSFQYLLKTQQAKGLAAYVDVSTIRRCLPTPIQPGWKVIAFTPTERLFKQLSLVKGVTPVLIPQPGGAQTPESQQQQLRQLLAAQLQGETDSASAPWIFLGQNATSNKPWYMVETLNS